MDSSIDPARLGGMTIHVGEVPAVDDVELAQHRLPNGDYEIPVDGRDKLSTDERIQPAEKLEAQSPNPCSRPQDVAEVGTLLQQVSLNTSCTLLPESPTPPVDPMRCETEAYHKLVNDGGRPVYSISLIQEVYRETEYYTEILRPWQVYKNSPDGIFQRQLRRWQNFRKWQNDNRDRDDDDGGFEAQSERQTQPSVMRDHDCRGFREYIEAAKGRLKLHGISQPFELNEDPYKQDKLTTWIEYLNYEYWCLDLHTRDIKRLGIEREGFWQELVDLELLKPHETKDFIFNILSAKDIKAEENLAIEAVQREMSKVERVKFLTRRDIELSDIPKAKRESMLLGAERALNDAKQQLEQAKKRSDLIHELDRATDVRNIAKDHAARQYIIVQWALAQLPQLLVSRTGNVASSLARKDARPKPEGPRRSARIAARRDTSRSS
ncbi:hypothetical protein MY4824_009489 [Beauveria thailandica]